MTRSINGATKRVVTSLYATLENLPEGSLSSEVAEHALSLAIYRPRPNNTDYVFHNYWKNARFSMIRTRARRSRVADELQRARATGFAVGTTGGQTSATPEELYEAAELEGRLRRVAAAHGPKVYRCLEGMLQGEPIEVTACAVGSSGRSVIRVRAMLRLLAAALFDVDRN